MSWLTSQSASLLVLGWLGFAIAIAVLSRWLVRVVVPLSERDQIQGIAAPLMPALGATFAVLMALTLASEASYVRLAQDLVSTEAAQASRLAWASTSPGVEAAPIQSAVTAYLMATRTYEWQISRRDGRQRPSHERRHRQPRPNRQGRGCGRRPADCHGQ